MNILEQMCDDTKGLINIPKYVLTKPERNKAL